jgi:hypothetical protein
MTSCFDVTIIAAEMHKQGLTPVIGLHISISKFFSTTRLSQDVSLFFMFAQVE